MQEDVAEHELRNLPSVNRLLQLAEIRSLSADFGHDLVVDAIRETLGRPQELPVSFDPRGARVIFIGNRS